ncbi:VOC family protein [Streptomyces chattanoogensis]|uniref:VOC family protein n=1 Tax=Streptomyces chattanoogensis TaxID=66876 RepID=UPI00367F8237
MSGEESMAGATARMMGAGFWAHDGKALADFYAAALGWKVTQTFGDTAVMISDGSEGATGYVFYTAKDFRAPDWPKDELAFHVDLSCDDIAATEKRLLSLGATKPEHQPGGDRWTVLLDPSGQPFCISAS